MQTGGARRKMKYLFFDTECANCFDKTGKLFSIGFVLTDENFNVLEPREDILINPDAPFDWFVVRKMMAYDRRIFKTKPKFDGIFPRLAELLDGAVAVGFNTAADVVYLLDECNRYHIEPPKIRFFDVQLWEQKLSERQNVCRLAAAYETWCGMEAHDAHRSDMDAEMTMDVAKAMCARLGINMDEAVAANPHGIGVLLCGSAHGVTMQANRFPGARAINALTPESAAAGRRDDHANIVCLAADQLDAVTMEQIIKTFCHTRPATDERYLRRVRRLDQTPATDAKEQ